ncbi:MAG TPA: hypothetical protein VJJ21_04840 [Candidatus Nanoarchaeia archaeon]|nr:hypothetical protein [Candidatus Nanoarchaeia archaeon]
MAVDALSATGVLILNPLVQLWNGFIEVLPGIVAALIILIIGYFVAMGIGWGITKLLEKTGIEKYMSKSKLSGAVGHTRITSILGEVVKWYVFLIFLQAGVDLLSLGTLSLYLDRFVMWLPNVIVAALVIIFGLAVSHIISMKIEEHTELNGVEFISKLVKVVLMTLIIIMALQQIGVNVRLLENLVLLLVGALAIGIAIALGVGLGGALKDDGKNIIKGIRGSLKH